MELIVMTLVLVAAGLVFAVLSYKTRNYKHSNESFINKIMSIFLFMSAIYFLLASLKS